jgi:hypothetical protein
MKEDPHPDPEPQHSIPYNNGKISLITNKETNKEVTALCSAMDPAGFIPYPDLDLDPTLKSNLKVAREQDREGFTSRPTEIWSRATR